jgi:hypothetical protein
MCEDALNVKKITIVVRVRRNCGLHFLKKKSGLKMEPITGQKIVLEVTKLIVTSPINLFKLVLKRTYFLKILKHYLITYLWISFFLELESAI